MPTEERLEKLERELTAAKRRNRWMLTVVLIVFALLLSAPAIIAQEKITGAFGMCLGD